MSKNIERPIPDSYWVRPGRLLAGEYPGMPETEAARYKLGQFLAAGVNTFLDLTEVGEHGLKPYAHLLQEEAVKLGRNVEHRRMPIPDMGTPGVTTMVRIIDAIESAQAAGQIVYVHCFGGLGRTGTVVGCYLVRQGLSGANALLEIARLRQGTPDGWKHSPETPAQRQMVENWPIGW
jgi:hypothetical protein